MNVITRGVRNAFRNVVRTVSIVVILGLSMGLALAMLVAHQAVGEKIKSVQASIGNTVSISPAGVRGFEGGGNALTETQLVAVQKLAHVTAMAETLQDRLTTDNSNLASAIDAGTLGQRFARNNGEKFVPRDNGNTSFAGGDQGAAVSFTPPISVTGTNTPARLESTQGGGTFKLTSGAVFTGNSTDNVALVGSTLAAKNSLKVGSTFTAYGTAVKVAGIFDAGNAFSNNQAIMPLATVQKLSNQAGAVTSATATIDSVTNVASATAAIQKSLGSAADVTNGAEEAQQAIAPLQNIQTISLYSWIGAVLAGAAIILMTMVMIVRERRREIGVIKAIGASNGTVMSQFMVEAATLTVLGSVIGIVLGVIAGNPITRLLVDNGSNPGNGMAISASPGGHAFAGDGRLRGAFGGLHQSLTNIHAVVGWDIIAYGLGAAILIAIAGSALASFFIAKIRPAEVMRAE
ncbi:MAG TPA: FtsX-like permease family protein [Candidatus Saccharimonadales bacterium]|nr:FtsX-like permease family protein [Candidatus Saccharimonadales bacterium]